MRQTFDFVTNLPLELILRICCFLDFRSLEAFSRSCRKAAGLLKSDLVWRDAFMQQFRPTRAFPRLENCWKAEFALRSQLLLQYQRGRGKSIIYDGRIGSITDVWLDSTNSRLIICNKSNGLVSISDPNTGKVMKSLIYPAATRTTSTEISVMCLSANSVIYGLNSGSIALNGIDRHGRSTGFTLLSFWHNDTVTAICIREKGQQGGPIAFITSSMDGSVKFWNLKTQQHPLTTVMITPHGIAKMSWDDAKEHLYLVSFNQDIFSLDLSADLETQSPQVRRLHRVGTEQSTMQWFDVLWDHKCNSVIIMTETSIIEYSTKFAPHAPREFLSGLKGRLLHLSLVDDCDNKSDAMNQTRIFAVADDAGSIAIFDAASSCTQTPRHIHLEGAQVTRLSVNSIVIAIGCHDGSVLLYNILDLSPLRPLAARISKYVQIAESDPARTAVQCVKLLPKHSSGVITIGGQIRAFDYQPQASHGKGKRRALLKGKHNEPHAISASSSTWKEEIRQGLSEADRIAKLQLEDERRFEKFTGPLGEQMTDDELIAYGSMLSTESTSAHASRDSSFDDSFFDPSKNCSLMSSSSDRTQNQTSTGLSTSTYQEDYDLAIALSKSIMHS